MEFNKKIQITLFILCTLQVHLQIVLGAQICLNFLSMGYRSLFGSNDHEGKVSKSRVGTLRYLPRISLQSTKLLISPFLLR